MTHDLNAYLLELRRLEHFRHECLIGWMAPEVLAEGERYACWAECAPPTRSCPAHAIGISTMLRRAPRYVIRYLVLHEVLHIVLPPRGARFHHRAFRVAEQSSDLYLPATRWLHAFAVRRGLRIAADPPKAHFSRIVLAGL